MENTATVSPTQHHKTRSVSPAISDSSGVSETQDLDDHFTLSKELLKREKEYIRKNKEIQLKSDLVVKKAELLVKEGKEHLQKPIAHYLIEPTAADDCEPAVESKPVVEVISRAAEYVPIVHKAAVPKRPTSAMKPSIKRATPVDMRAKRAGSVTPTVGQILNAKESTKMSVAQPRTSSNRPPSAFAKLQPESAPPASTSFVLGPMEEGIGLEATNRLLKAKLVVIQEEMEKVVKNQAIKDNAISILEEKLKFFDEERMKITKNMQTLQTQIDKSNRSNTDLKARNEILETERTSMKKELDALSKERRTTENDVNSKDLRLNRALEEIEKLKHTLNKANADSKDKMENLKKNQQALLTENKKLTKQKAELFSVFKKQNLLIDNLKRQKLHLEAAALLDFSEEEFVRALNCRPMAGKDI
ncbi:Golgin sub A member 2 [Podochytrium sp. JEL0797]|nr:Golgin sub A member 2 [Podochytrium sp. JEL0797]